MRPVNSRFFGAGSGRIRARFNNGTSVVNGYIVKQVSADRYRVSDGTVVRTCRFARTPAEAATLTPGLMTIRATVRGGGAILAPLYDIRVPSGASIVAGGTGYVAGQLLTVVGGLGTPATLTVGSIGGGGAITAISAFPSQGLYSALPGDAGTGFRSVTVTGTAGAGATIRIAFEIAQIRVDAGGSGYRQGQTVAFSGGDSASLTGTISIGSVTSAGAIVSVTTATQGIIGTPPTGFTTSGASENLRRLFTFRCRTVEGGSYPWSTSAREGRAQLELIP